MLVDIARQYESILYLGANKSSSSEVELFLCRTRTPYTSRWMSEATIEIPWKFSREFNGRNCRSTTYQPRQESKRRIIVRSLDTRKETSLTVCHSFLTQPNMYARGILFGKMKYELGDHSVVRCPENNLSADIEFKTKGWVGGTYNAIAGIIKNDKTGEALYELSGMWTGEMIAKNLKVSQQSSLEFED